MRIIQQILRTKCTLQTCKNFGTLLPCIISSQYHKFFPLLCDLHTLAFIKVQWIGGSHQYCGGTCRLKFQVIYTRLQGVASYSEASTINGTLLEPINGTLLEPMCLELWLQVWCFILIHYNANNLCYNKSQQYSYNKKKLIITAILYLFWMWIQCSWNFNASSSAFTLFLQSSRAWLRLPLVWTSLFSCPGFQLWNHLPKIQHYRFPYAQIHYMCNYIHQTTSWINDAVQYRTEFTFCISVQFDNEDSQFSTQTVLVVLRIEIHVFRIFVSCLWPDQSRVHGSFYGFQFVDWPRFYFWVL